MDQGRKAKVIYIPDPLCWTEAPSNNKILGRQRNRWMRGTIETLHKHRKLFLNPRYKLLGMLSYPYWFMFEFLAPWVEFLGLLFFIYLMATGRILWEYSLVLILLVYSIALFFSLLTLMAEELSFYKYSKRSDFYKMVITALLEPLIFHPRVVFWALRGNFDKIRGTKTWGEMSRTGFIKTETKK